MLTSVRVLFQPENIVSDEDPVRLNYSNCAFVKMLSSIYVLNIRRSKFLGNAFLVKNQYTFTKLPFLNPCPFIDNL